MTSPIETNNVVERLRDGDDLHSRLEGADEIERLRSENQFLSDRIDVLREAVDQYQNAPYRSADWLANEVMTILGVVANDAHPLTQGGKNATSVD